MEGLGREGQAGARQACRLCRLSHTLLLPVTYSPASAAAPALSSRGPARLQEALPQSQAMGGATWEAWHSVPALPVQLPGSREPLPLLEVTAPASACQEKGLDEGFQGAALSPDALNASAERSDRWSFCSGTRLWWSCRRKQWFCVSLGGPSH